MLSHSPSLRIRRQLTCLLVVPDSDARLGKQVCWRSVSCTSLLWWMPTERISVWCNLYVSARTLRESMTTRAARGTHLLAFLSSLVFAPAKCWRVVAEQPVTVFNTALLCFLRSLQRCWRELFPAVRVVACVVPLRRLVKAYRHDHGSLQIHGRDLCSA
jgi:hypothetical protein